jgi:predicted DNA-binding transcriptional regulator AlpA
MTASNTAHRTDETEARLSRRARQSGDRLITEKQVAEMLGLNPSTVRHWRMRRAVLPFIEIGGSIRYSLAAVEAELARRTVPINGKKVQR